MLWREGEKVQCKMHVCVACVKSSPSCPHQLPLQWPERVEVLFPASPPSSPGAKPKPVQVSLSPQAHTHTHGTGQARLPAASTGTSPWHNGRRSRKAMARLWIDGSITALCASYRLLVIIIIIISIYRVYRERVIYRVMAQVSV